MTMKQVQNLLQYLGYYKDIPDDLYGPKTLEAITKFQTVYEKMGIDGIQSPQLEAALLDAVATGKYFKPAPEETPEQPQEEPDSDDFWAGIKYFKREEFRCKCGGKYCDGFPAEPQPGMVYLADAAREYFGWPGRVVSGLRCPEWNRIQGGTANSQHMYGEAVDLRIDGVSAADLLAFIKRQPGVRYAYAINSTNVHIGIPYGKR